jgi:formylmethanofuran dehydrogenase subunit E
MDVRVNLVPLVSILFMTSCITPRDPGLSTGSGTAHKESAEWYYFDWMVEAEHAPVFRVLDTESSLGPYAGRAKTLTLKDLVKMHGHACDGLFTAACALSVGLRELYPDGVIDRTDTGGVCNNSPCFGDAVEYLTGGRIRFGTQKIDPSLGNEFIVYQFSTGRAVQVALKSGVFPAELSALEKKIRGGAFSEEEMRRCQLMQWEYAKKLVSRPLSESFTVSAMTGFVWQPDTYPNLGKRGDIINKDCLKKRSRRF